MDNEENIGVIRVGIRCSNRCVFCMMTYSTVLPDSATRKNELEIHRELLKHKKNGVTDIFITGCDPLEYPKLVNLIKYIKKMGFRKIYLCTHGRVKDNSIVSDLVEAGVDEFRIPLYGSNAQIHDSVTQVPGSFDEVMNCIRQVKTHNTVLRVITVIVQQNKDDIMNILRLADTYKPKLFEIDVAHLYPSVKDTTFLVPYKDLPIRIKPIVEYIESNGRKNITFNDIPYCIFGEVADYIIIPENHFSHEKPKGYTKICEQCSVKDKCPGFFMNDIDKWGTGDIKPIGGTDDRE